MRNTIQKQIILDTVRSMRDHPNADEIFAKISRRTSEYQQGDGVQKFKSYGGSGHDTARETERGPDRYDFNTPKHYHMRCRACGRIFDAPMATLDHLEETLGDTHGFEAQDHIIEFIGICPDCKNKK